MKSTSILYLLAAILMFAACKEPSSTPTSTPKTVYVLGTQGGRPKLWKNLNDSIKLPDNATITSFAIEGSEVYLFGYKRPALGAVVYKTWKNGIETSITDGTNDAVATAFYVSGSDVYVAGYSIIRLPMGGTRTLAMLWKNGVATIIGNSVDNSTASAVYAVGNSVNVAWQHVVTNTTTNTNVGLLKLWTNGVSTTLSDGIRYVYPTSLFVTGTNTYVLSTESPAIFQNVPRIWRNGVATNLLSAPELIAVNSLFVDGNDYYVTGYNFVPAPNNSPVAKYWKNDRLFLLSSSTGNAYANSVYVADGKTYVAGSEYKFIDLQTAAKTNAVVWVDGVSKALTNGVENSTASKIIVK